MERNLLPVTIIRLSSETQKNGGVKQKDVVLFHTTITFRALTDYGDVVTLPYY